MLDCNRVIRKKMKTLLRTALLVLPVFCLILLLSQTAFAKNTYLINDGGRVMIHTTYATDPAEVLDEAGLNLGEEDTFTTQPGFGVSEITVRRMQKIMVVYDGKTLEATSYGETVQELLDRLGFSLTQEASVSVSMSAQTYDGMTVTISRTVTVEETFVNVVPYRVTYCNDASLPYGEEAVLTQGVDGRIRSVVSVCYVNGKEVSRKVLSETVLEQPVDMLIAVGTYVEPTEEQKPETKPEPEAKPETKPEPKPETKPVEVPEKDMPYGDGRLVIADGKITLPSGEVLTYSDYGMFVATAYCREEVGGQITAIGTPTRVGAIAVDPKVIPYGTKMFIVTQDGKYIYGIAVAEDCGSAIKGNRIDLFYETMPECVQFGIRKCDVYFLD